MGRLTRDEKEIIAYNISEQRKRKYPGHGGGKKCAKEFGVPAQQWSPWESGSRTPDDNRLTQIAKFFKVTVAELRQEPENWEKVRPGWMATKRKSKRRELEAAMEPPPPPQTQPSPAPAMPVADSGDMMAILKLLTDCHGKVESGEMSAADYAGKMRQLLDFARFILEK